MKLKIASFNISGGFYGGDESIEYLDREAVESYDNKFLNEIIKIINEENLDIICFQEIITTEKINYIKKIVDETNLKYSVEFELSPCNIIKDTDCGLAILSKYPITNYENGKFTNPMLAKITSSGKTYYTFDKGYIICYVNVDGNNIKVLTHHGFPFRRFNSTPEENVSIFKEFDNVIKNNNVDIITGDFNADNFMLMMDYTKLNYVRTINQVTTVDGKMFDDILLRKNYRYKSSMIKSLSDHYIVINNIEICKE